MATRVNMVTILLQTWISLFATFLDFLMWSVYTDTAGQHENSYAEMTTEEKMKDIQMGF